MYGHNLLHRGLVLDARDIPELLRLRHDIPEEPGLRRGSHELGGGRGLGRQRSAHDEGAEEAGGVEGVLLAETVAR